MTGYLENEEITVGRPLVIAIDVTADTTDNTLLLSSDYDANGDGSAETDNHRTGSQCRNNDRRVLDCH